MQIIAVKQVKRVNSAPLYCSKNLALCITLSINKRIYYVGKSQTRDVPLITLCAVCARGLCDKSHLCIYVCVYVVNYQPFGNFLVKNSQKSTHGAFISHLDVVNVMVDCEFTPGRAI